MKTPIPTPPLDDRGKRMLLSNWAKLQRYWCNCVHKHKRIAFLDPDWHSGLMCDNCHGLVKVEEP